MAEDDVIQDTITIKVVWEAWCKIWRNGGRPRESWKNVIRIILAGRGASQNNSTEEEWVAEVRAQEIRKYKNPTPSGKGLPDYIPIY